MTAGDGCVHHWYGLGGLTLQHTVECLWPSDGHQAVGIDKFGKAADLTVVLEQRSDCHEAFVIALHTDSPGNLKLHKTQQALLHPK